MIEDNRTPKVAVVFHYLPSNAFHMINVGRDESLTRLRSFWEILGNLSAEDHRFFLSETVALPEKGYIRDILPEKSFVIGILVEPVQPFKYESNGTLATNFSDTLSMQDIWDTLETDRRPTSGRMNYRLTLSSDDNQKRSLGAASPFSRVSTLSAAENVSQEFSFLDGEVQKKTELRPERTPTKRNWININDAMVVDTSLPSGPISRLSLPSQELDRESEKLHSERTPTKRNWINIHDAMVVDTSLPSGPISRFSLPSQELDRESETPRRSVTPTSDWTVKSDISKDQFRDSSTELRPERTPTKLNWININDAMVVDTTVPSGPISRLSLPSQELDRESEISCLFNSLATEEIKRAPQRPVTLMSDRTVNSDVSMDQFLDYSKEESPQRPVTPMIDRAVNTDISMDHFRDYSKDFGIIRQPDRNVEQLDEISTPPTVRRWKSVPNSEEDSIRPPNVSRSESVPGVKDSIRPPNVPRSESVTGVKGGNTGPLLADEVGCLQKMKWPIGFTRSSSRNSKGSELAADESSHSCKAAKFVMVCKWSQETFDLRITFPKEGLMVKTLRADVESRVGRACRMEQYRGVRMTDSAKVVDIDFGFFFAGEDGIRSQRSLVKDIVLHSLSDGEEPLLIPGSWSSMIFITKK